MAALFIASTPIVFDQTGITNYATKDIDPNGTVTGKVVLARGINTAPAGTLPLPPLSQVVTFANAKALQNNLDLTNQQRNATVGLRFGEVLLYLVGATRFPVDHARRWIRLAGINLFRSRTDGAWLECAIPHDLTPTELADYLAARGVT